MIANDWGKAWRLKEISRNNRLLKKTTLITIKPTNFLTL